MRKTLLATAFFFTTLILCNSSANAQFSNPPGNKFWPGNEPAQNAYEKGQLVNPSPKIISYFIEHHASEFLNYIIWYKYKGYYFGFVGLDEEPEESNYVLVYTPNGELINFTFPFFNY